eukprot:1307599-Lingulodinium_polyedra.AAC.1
MNPRKSCSSPHAATIAWSVLDPRALAVDMPLSPDVSPDRSRTPERFTEPGAPLRGVWAEPEEGRPEPTGGVGTGTGAAEGPPAAPAAPPR